MTDVAWPSHSPTDAFADCDGTTRLSSTVSRLDRRTLVSRLVTTDGDGVTTVTGALVSQPLFDTPTRPPVTPTDSRRRDRPERVDTTDPLPGGGHR